MNLLQIRPFVGKFRFTSSFNFNFPYQLTLINLLYQSGRSPYSYSRHDGIWLVNAGLHPFLRSAAEGSERSGLRPNCLTVSEKPSLPIE